MSIFDSQEFIDQKIRKRVTDLEKQVADLQDPSNQLTVSSLKITDSDTRIDNDGITIGEQRVIQDGKWIADLINSNLDTAGKQILGEFSFGASGAIVINTDEDNGVWISPTGILAKQGGVTKFTLPISGNPTFGGTLVAAAGTLGTITSGLITGATVQTAASGYRAVMTSANGFQLYNGGTWQGTLQADSAASVVLNSAGNIYLMRNGNQMAFFQSSSVDFPTNYRFNWAGGRWMQGEADRFKFNTKIEVDGDVFPDNDNTVNLGGSGSRWKDGYIKEIHTGDIVFSDTHCPVCEKELKSGDVLSLYLYKQEDSENYSVPAHTACLEKMKDKSIEDMKVFIKNKEVETEANRKTRMSKIKKI